MRRITLLTVCALCCACIEGPDEDEVARPQADPAGVSGAYCFQSGSLNVRTVHPMYSSVDGQTRELASPDVVSMVHAGRFTGIPLGRVADSTLLEVLVTDSELTVTYHDRFSSLPGRITRPISDVTKGEVSIELPTVRAGVSFGIGTSRRWMTLTRGADGTLTYIEWYRERALAFFVLPMQKTRARAAVLDPVNACG